MKDETELWQQRKLEISECRKSIRSLGRAQVVAVGGVHSEEHDTLVRNRIALEAARLRAIYGGQVVDRALVSIAADDIWRRGMADSNELKRGLGRYVPRKGRNAPRG